MTPVALGGPQHSRERRLKLSGLLLQSAAAPPEAFPLHLGVQAGEGERPHPAAGEHGGVHDEGEEERTEPSSAAGDDFKLSTRHMAFSRFVFSSGQRAIHSDQLYQPLWRLGIR